MRGRLIFGERPVLGLLGCDVSEEGAGQGVDFRHVQKCLHHGPAALSPRAIRPVRCRHTGRANRCSRRSARIDKKSARVEISGRTGIQWGELSWTVEDNGPVNVGIKFMGGKIYKKYRVYERML